MKEESCERLVARDSCPCTIICRARPHLLVALGRDGLRQGRLPLRALGLGERGEAARISRPLLAALHQQVLGLGQHGGLHIVGHRVARRDALAPDAREVARKPLQGLVLVRV